MQKFKVRPKYPITHKEMQPEDPDVVKVDGGYRMYYGEFAGAGEFQSNILSAFCFC